MKSEPTKLAGGIAGQSTKCEVDEHVRLLSVCTVRCRFYGNVLRQLLFETQDETPLKSSHQAVVKRAASRLLQL